MGSCEGYGFYNFKYERVSILTEVINQELNEYMRINFLLLIIKIQCTRVC